MKKIKNIKALLIISLLIINYLNAQQEPLPETKAYILNMLQSEDYFDRSSVIGDATYVFHIPEVVPILEHTILTQGRTLAFHYLIALSKYNSPNFISLAHWFINSVDTLVVENSSFKDVLEMKVDITMHLVKRGDFSTIQFVFDLIEREKPKTFIGSANVLDKIVIQVPEYTNAAKTELIRLATLGEQFESYNAINSLIEHYGNEITPILVEVFNNSSYRPEKALALDGLIQFEYPGLEELIRNRMVQDSSMTTAILETIIQYYPTPYNYNFIKNRLDQIPRKQTVSLLFQGFISDSSNTINNSTEQLNYSYTLVDTILTYNWLGDLTFSNELKNILTTAKNNLQIGDSLSCRVQVKTFQDLVDNVYKDSLNTDPRFVTIEGWKFLYWNAQYILDRLPEPPANPNLVVKLKNSLGNQIPASNVTYYDNSWKDAVNNGDGTFTVITTKPKVSIRVYYEYASLQADNVTAQNNTYTFQTVSAQVQLKNSLGAFIDQGTVQYYAGAWRSFGTTSNGVAYKELLPINYSFRMTYEYGSIDKQQNLSSDPTVIFQTVNAAVQLKNSLGSLIDQGTVQYYAGTWRTFGTTSNGVAYKELLPINYSFRMTYEYGSIDKQQNLSTDPTVVFQTVNAAVQLKNSSGNLMPAPMGDQGTVQYYAGAWRTFGTTSNGVAYKELLPTNYSFRMTYEYVSKDKQQNLSTNPVVDFNTVLCSVKVSKTSNNQPVSNAAVKYYAGAWRNLGTTNSSGVAAKELLPANISFRATSGSVSVDKQQDISVNNLVEILLNIP